MVTLYTTGNLPEAQAIADEAVHDARLGSSARVRSRALALQTEMTARAANTHRAFATLHNAWQEIDHTGDQDTAPGAFDAGRLHGFEGVCQLYAGDPDKAERQFADSAAILTRPRDSVQRGIVRTDQAKARILPAAPEAATALLHECIDLSAGTRGRVPAQRIREARLALSPWRSEHFVTELDTTFTPRQLRAPSSMPPMLCTTSARLANRPALMLTAPVDYGSDGRASDG
jgi:hypothetical protein